MSTLRVTEIFHSLQGEAKYTGLPTVFVRLTGCPLRCVYCDSAYAFSGGIKQSFDQLVEKIQSFETPYVTITGGEPLAQKNVLPFISLLCDKGYTVSIETSGALDISSVDQRATIVMDLKTPASGEHLKNRYENVAHLKTQDQIKFVISDRSDYDWVKKALDTHQLEQKCEILMSPSFGVMKPDTLADWIISDRIKVRFQLQLHKLLWDDTPGK